jgi:hypothetical protein
LRDDLSADLYSAYRIHMCSPASHTTADRPGQTGFTAFHRAVSDAAPSSWHRRQHLPPVTKVD